MQKTGYILTLLTLLTIMLANSAVFAQNETVQNDTTINNTPLKAPLLDSTLLHTSIFTLLESPDTGNGKITVNQSWNVKRTFINYIQTNNLKKKNGYRIRIFFDNAQNARSQSEYIKNIFNRNFPDIPAYMSSSNPFFKVTVGNFRTRTDAARALDIIKLSYPSAFIVREAIDYPAI
jgi:hypothetical protein